MNQWDSNSPGSWKTMAQMKLHFLATLNFPDLTKLTTETNLHNIIIWPLIHTKLLLLNYCNFEEYSKCILVIPDVPIRRITKSHEEVPSIVIQVISNL